MTIDNQTDHIDYQETLSQVNMLAANYGLQLTYAETQDVINFLVQSLDYLEDALDIFNRQIDAEKYDNENFYYTAYYKLEKGKRAMDVEKQYMSGLFTTIANQFEAMYSSRPKNAKNLWLFLRDALRTLEHPQALDIKDAPILETESTSTIDDVDKNTVFQSLRDWWEKISQAKPFLILITALFAIIVVCYYL